MNKPKYIIAIPLVGNGHLNTLKAYDVAVREQREDNVLLRQRKKSLSRNAILFQARKQKSVRWENVKAL